MKKNTLRKMLFLHSAVFVGVICLLFLVLYIALMMGVREHLYTFADSEEKQVEVLQQQIASKQAFEPSWVPEDIGYLQVNSAGEVVESNLNPDDREKALAYLEGKTIPYSEGYFEKVPYKDGTCIFKYHIGVRYTSTWANEHLPRLELFFILILVLIVVIPTMWFARVIARRIYKDVMPLQTAVVSIGQGDLNVPIPPLSIYEFDELGQLVERMRTDLKATLENLWTNEQQLKEQTTQMLHDYRSPLTVARANAEFLKEDLAQLSAPALDDSSRPGKAELLTYAETIVFNLDRLTEVADRLQLQMKHDRVSSVRTEQLALQAFNHRIDQEGAMLSHHYGNVWEGRFQETDLCADIEESALQQALTNIILNACEHGQAPQTICMDFSVSDGEAEYRIANSGSHFSAQALAHATEKGFSEKADGSQVMKGLGLYFTAKVLQDKGGKLLISNTDDGCACVQVVIPVLEKQTE